MLCAQPSPNRYALIGFENKKVTTAVGNTTAAASFTVLHELPEKLPNAQCVRLAISESFANVMHKSVIAEQI